MARYQKIKEVSGWDNVDLFYNREINGININAFGFIRSFCKCGSVTDKFRDKCNDCDNFDFISWTEGWPSNYLIDTKEFFEKHGSIGSEDLIIGENLLVVETDMKKEKAIFKLIKDKLLIISKNKIEELDSFRLGKRHFNKRYFNYGVFVGDVLKTEYKYWDNYEKVTKLLDSKDLRTLEIAIELYNEYPKLINDPLLFQYPSLAKGIILDLKNAINESVNNNMKHLKIPEEYMPALDYNFKNKQFRNLYEIAHHRKGVYDYESTFHSVLLKIKNKKLYGFEGLLEHYFTSNLIDWYELRSISKKIMTICDSSRDMYGFSSSWKYYRDDLRYYSKSPTNESFRTFFKDSYMDYFEIFFKDNIMNLREYVVEGFIEQIKEMQDNKIDFNEDNFKIKNYNFLLNQKTLSEKYRLPEGKVDMFLDMFEINPLESLELIKNRRKMTKKEMEAFLEVMMKNS